MHRKDAILQAACDHFGRFGFRGASLRDIARDAGVSLPLLTHHFGDKDHLLVAVINTQRAMLQERIASLQRLTRSGPGTFLASDLVQSWIRIGFDTASTEAGEMFLRLQLRVMDEPAEEGLAVTCEALDDAASLFAEALQHCYPHASNDAVWSAYVFVNASLLKFLTAAQRRFRFVQAARPEDAAIEDAMRLKHFLVGGIDAMLGTQDHAPHHVPVAAESQRALLASS